MNLEKATFALEDPTTLRVTAPAATEEHVYDLDFLYSQRDRIQASLDEVNTLIGQAEGLGIVTKASLAAATITV